MEPSCSFASKEVDLSFVSNADISQPLAFDSLFNKVANVSNLTFGQFGSRARSGCNQGSNGGVLAANFLNSQLQSKSKKDSNTTMQSELDFIHNLTFPMAFLNSSYISHVTDHSSATTNSANIHHRLQTLKYMRCNPQISISTVTTSKDIEVSEISCTNGHKNSSANHMNFNTVTVTKDISLKKSTETGSAQNIPCASDNKENRPIVVKSKASPTPMQLKDSALCKEKRKVRQTPKMAALTQSPSKLVRLKKALKPVVELTDWIIRPLPDSRGICVEGKKDGGLDFWHSTAIAEVKSEKHVMTASGSEYHLHGKINKLCTIDSGFSADVAKAFKNGFPKNWKEVIKQFYTDLEDSIMIHEEISPMMNAKPKKKVSSKQQHQTKKEAKQKSKLTPKTGAEKKLTPTNASKVTTKLKPSVNEDDMDSVLTPVGLVRKSAPTASLTVTRSGRLSLPPLARWSGQKYVLRNSEILVDFETKDAQRATMEETKAIYKLSKPFQKMLNYKNKNCNSPTMPPTTPTESLKSKQQNKRKTSANVSSKSSARVTKIRSIDKASIMKEKTVKSPQQRSCHDLSESLESTTKNKHPKIPKQESSPTKYQLSDSFKNLEKDASKHSRQIMNNSSSQNSGKKRSLRRSSSELKKCSVMLKKEKLTPKRNAHLNKKEKQSDKKKTCESRSNSNRRRNRNAIKKRKRSPSCSPAFNDKSTLERNSHQIMDNSSSQNSGKKRTLRRSSSKLKKCNVILKKERLTPKRNALLNKKEKQSDKKKTCESRSNSNVRENRNAVKKRKRSPSCSPAFNDKSTTERNCQSSVDVTPKSTSKARVLKRRRLNEDGSLQDSWSTHEIDCLQRALRIVNGGLSNFWEEVAALVRTRTQEECQQYHTKYLEDKTADRFQKQKQKPQHLPGRQKGDPVRGKKGTLKRKKEIRAFLDEQNDGYEDNLFDGTPFVSRKPVSSLIHKIGFDKADDEIFGSNCNFFTPRPGQDESSHPQSCLRMPFASTKKTPTCLTGFTDSPASVKRVCADKYIHTFMENKKRTSSGAGNHHAQGNDSDLESSLLPKKSLFSTAGKTSIFLEDDDPDLHDDDEEDKRYMYYWNDLDCSQ